MVIVALLVLVAGLAVGSQAFYIVNEFDQVVLLEFGRPVKVDTMPGIYPKAPFVHTVERMDKRILVSDAQPQEYLTLDRERLVVDHVSRWRISDPLAFFQTVRNEFGALARLDDIIMSELRAELGRATFQEIIGPRREEIMHNVSVRVAETAARQSAGGLEVIDVRMKRADLPPEVQQSVFARIVAERSRIASQYRAEGEEQAFRIRAQADFEKEVILATAFEESQRTRGEGDAQSTAIYADAYNRDPEFFSFTRNLEAYDRYLRQRSTLVMSGDGDLFRYLNAGPPAQAPASP